ncbi:MAG: hypothetical protein UY63_C0001G0069 [Parcubacteria group bacterium GW2011_GWA2_51_10]|nr:MAG: hypothetical protein UY63_C0001G0069 [Parcubacteria group bacterium GW2011_GWA2_51_10]
MTRQQKITGILAKLQDLKTDPRNSSRAYAIAELERFLRAAHSPMAYAAWLIGHARKMDASLLLELTDFPYDPWDEEMHTELIALERREKPGLVRPLVKEISKTIIEANRDVTIASAGAGGMEVDRQVIEYLKRVGYTHRVTIVGIDMFESTHEIASRTLGATESVSIERNSTLDSASVDAARARAHSQFTIILCTNDIFSLPESFPDGYFDLAYHSLFKHHLDGEQQRKLDDVLHRVSKTSIEFDGYKSWLHGIIQSIFAWHSPVFLNGTIFSMARYKTRAQIRSVYPDAIFFTNTAHYLRRF